MTVDELEPSGEERVVVAEERSLVGCGEETEKLGACVRGDRLCHLDRARPGGIAAA